MNLYKVYYIVLNNIFFLKLLEVVFIFEMLNNQNALQNIDREELLRSVRNNKIMWGLVLFATLSLLALTIALIVYSNKEDEYELHNSHFVKIDNCTILYSRKSNCKMSVYYAQYAMTQNCVATDGNMRNKTLVCWYNKDSPIPPTFHSPERELPKSRIIVIIIFGCLFAISLLCLLIFFIAKS